MQRKIRKNSPSSQAERARCSARIRKNSPSSHAERGKCSAECAKTVLLHKLSERSAAQNPQNQSFFPSYPSEVQRRMRKNSPPSQAERARCSAESAKRVLLHEPPERSPAQNPQRQSLFTSYPREVELQIRKISPSSPATRAKSSAECAKRVLLHQLPEGSAAQNAQKQCFVTR